MDRVIDLSFKKYESLLYNGDVDDQDYHDWYYSEVWAWLRVAKNKYNQDYIRVKADNKVYKEYYNDYYEEV